MATIGELFEAMDKYIEEAKKMTEQAFILKGKFEQLQAENKLLKERIEMAVEYLPECPDKALSFLEPALQEKPK